MVFRSPHPGQRRTVYGPQGIVEQTVIELTVDFGGFASLVGAYCRLHRPEGQPSKMEPVEVSIRYDGPAEPQPLED